MVIALDPGHGGTNTGLSYNGFLEKHMTRITAQAMKEELEKYEGVEVYITNPDEENDMSLKDRAANAKSAGADVLISLHFNMSEEHTMFGSEVWIPCNGLPYADMHSLGDLFIDEFNEIGLTVRGVKTRLNDRGTDYYGILRESVALDLNAILVEHCYADHSQDADYIAAEDNWKAFGKMDATAVAKYYHLKSKDGKTDYSEFVKNGYFAPEEAVGPDRTGPEAVSIEWLGAAEGQQKTESAGEAEGESTGDQAADALEGAGAAAADEQALTPDGRVRTTNAQRYHIQGNEPETSIVYYEYSYDGGQTWSGLLPFAKGQTEMDIEVPGVMPGDKFQARLYNGYTVSGKSNIITYKPAPPMEAIDPDKDVESLTLAYETGKRTLDAMEQYYGISLVWNMLGMGLAALCILGFTATVLEGRRYHKREAERRKKELIDEKLSGAFWEKDEALTQPENPEKSADTSLTAELKDSERKERNRLIAKNRSRITRAKFAWIIAGIFLLAGAFVPKYILSQAKQEAKLAAEDAYLAKEEGIRINAEHEELRKKQEKEALELIVTDKGEVEGEYQPKAEVPMTTIYDIAKGYMRVPLLNDIAKNPYDLKGFSGEGLQKSYTGGAKIGIDVSKFQGEIDWNTVAASGVSYAIIRLGSRGYGSGELVMDEKFTENIEGAAAAGIKTGVYFFSTAKNDKEAVEEADYVLDAISGYTIDMPVVFDTEIITYDKARNANMTPNQLTSATKAFCDRISKAGYKPMIYANAKRFTTVLHLEELEGYEKWLADYRAVPDYPYSFNMWQFTEHGKVPGITGDVDINLWFN